MIFWLFTGQIQCCLLNMRNSGSNKIQVTNSKQSSFACLFLIMFILFVPTPNCFPPLFPSQLAMLLLSARTSHFLLSVNSNIRSNYHRSICVTQSRLPSSCFSSFSSRFPPCSCCTPLVLPPDNPLFAIVPRGFLSNSVLTLHLLYLSFPPLLSIHSEKMRSNRCSLQISILPT